MAYLAIFLLWGLIIMMNEDSVMTNDDCESFSEVILWNIINMIKVKDTAIPSDKSILEKNCTFGENRPMNAMDRITYDPEICKGKPCIRGMRWPVSVLLDLLGSGMSFDEILSDHPELEGEDILAARLFQGQHNSNQTFNPNS